MGLFGKRPHSRDSDNRGLDKHRKPTNELCKVKYQTKDSKGKTVTRTCIKKKGHGGKHQ